MVTDTKPTICIVQVYIFSDACWQMAEQEWDDTSGRWQLWGTGLAAGTLDGREPTQSDSCQGTSSSDVTTSSVSSLADHWVNCECTVCSLWVQCESTINNVHCEITELIVSLLYVRCESIVSQLWVNCESTINNVHCEITELIASVSLLYVCCELNYECTASLLSSLWVHNECIVLSPLVIIWFLFN